MRIILLIGLALFVAACTPPVSDRQLDEFGRQTVEVSEVLATPARLQTALLAGDAENRRLCAYLSGRNFALLPAPARSGPSQTARDMALLADALGDYADALAEAAGSGSLSRLEAAAAGLKAGAARLTSPTGSAVSDAIVNAGLRVGDRRRQERIRAIMTDVFPRLIQLERRLILDAPSVTNENRTLMRQWEGSARCVLARVRADRSEAVDQYGKFNEERAAFEADLLLAQQAPAVVQALKEAHLLIITQPDDIKTALNAFQTRYNDIRAIARTVPRRPVTRNPLTGRG